MELLYIIGIVLIITFSILIIILLQNSKNRITDTTTQSDNKELVDKYQQIESEYENLQLANQQLMDQYEDLKKMEERHKKLAYTDYLTDLPNRTDFMEYLDYAVSNIKKGQISAIMYVDIDNFKGINDDLGRSYGDELLIDCAERLKKFIDKNDYLACFSGDKFVIYSANVVNMWEYEEKVNELQRLFSQPFILSLKEYFITVSIGVVFTPKDGDNSQTLIKNAEMALFHAKKLGKNNISFYEPSLNNQMTSKMEAQSELHTAIANGQFELYYQAQVDVDSDHIVGFEALVRWNHPEKGIISADKFIPLAEDTGMISEIGSWVLFEACRQLKEWQDMGYHDITVAVNLSARQFKDPSLVTMVESAVKQAGIQPKDLELEIKENIALDDITYSIDTIQQLKEIGIKVSLDDFGTGYSSLNYLKHLPVSNIKIDKSFMDTIIEDKSDIAIVSAMITLARNFNLDVIAEGVENSEQASFLKEAQCNIVQGYLYSVPVSKEDADSLLKNMGSEEIHNLFRENH